MTIQDALTLYQSNDLLQLGQRAHHRQLTHQGKNVYYCVNRHINYTNGCRMKCHFCGFSRDPDHPDSYIMPPETVADQAEKAWQNGASEVHIVGGINPGLPYDYYLNMLQKTRLKCPKLYIKAFTAAEIVDLSDKSGQSIKNTLENLQEAGLNGLPGGGAEILSDDFFERFCPNKARPNQWLNVHATAHALGMMTNATMLYGYQETPAERIEHLFTLRKLQDCSLQKGRGAFQSFVPLPYIPPTDTAGKTSPKKIDAISELKTIAISRLVLDNIPHIKAFWPMLGEKLAQIALCFGANDLDGTVQTYKIVDKKTDNPNDVLTEQQIREMILETNLTPVKRDALYHSLEPND